MRLGVLWRVCCWHGVMYLKYDLRFVYLDARVGLCYRVLTRLTLNASFSGSI